MPARVTRTKKYEVAKRYSQDCALADTAAGVKDASPAAAVRQIETVVKTADMLEDVIRVVPQDPREDRCQREACSSRSMERHSKAGQHAKDSMCTVTSVRSDKRTTRRQ